MPLTSSTAAREYLPAFLIGSPVPRPCLARVSRRCAMARETARIEAAYNLIKWHGTAREKTAAAHYLAYGRPADLIAAVVAARTSAPIRLAA